jgi:ABC-type uncharacterized transport system substrate-binding protein
MGRGQRCSNSSQEFAKELVTLQPDLIVAITTPVTRALQSETQTFPIVFVIMHPMRVDFRISGEHMFGRRIIG